MGAPKGRARPDMVGNQYAKDNVGRSPDIYTQEWLENEAIELLEWFKVPRNIWLKGFALTRGYDPARLDEFADSNKVFAQALLKAKQMQEFKLVDKGLFNETNANITKFVLTNNHGWAERSTITHKGRSVGDELLGDNDGNS